MPLKKKYLKTKPVCKVTFNLPKDAAGDAKAIFLVGEFNNWNTKSLPMKPLKSGGHTITVDLESGKDYQYRYLTDKGAWINDPEADRYEFSAFAGGDNCVVTV